MATPLNRDLRAETGERTKDLDVVHARDYLDNRLPARLSARHQQLQSIKRGTSLGRFFPGGTPPSMLESFRTKNTTPRRDQTFHETEEASNTVQPVNCVIRQQSCSYKQPAVYDLLLLHKNPDLRSNTAHFDEMMVECAPQEMVVPEVFNYILWRKQRAMFDSDDRTQYERYKALVPNDWWKDFACWGVVETITPWLHQAGPNLHHGEGMLGPLVGSDFRVGTQPLPGDDQMGMSRATVDSKGPQFTHNVFGPNIRAGGDVYAVLKKFPVNNDYALSEKHSLRLIDSSLRNDALHRFFPVQLAFFCMPNGGPVPDAARMYLNEDGVRCYDSIVVRLGRIHSVPIDHAYQDVDYSTLRPFTGLRNTYPPTYESSMLPTVNFDISNAKMPY